MCGPVKCQPWLGTRLLSELCLDSESALAHLVAGVAVGLTHRELIVLVLFVEAEGKAEHVSVVVGGRSTIVIKLITLIIYYEMNNVSTYRW